MDSNDFVQWLQGFMDAGGSDQARIRDKIKEVKPVLPSAPYFVPTNPYPYNWPRWQDYTIWCKNNSISSNTMQVNHTGSYGLPGNFTLL